MMPFLNNRLISEVRCLIGIDKDTFYMKHFNSNSKNLGKKVLMDKNNKKSNYYYFYIKNCNGLIEEVQMNGYEFHIWGCKQNSINNHDLLVFDLDPDENLPISKVKDAAKDLKTILDELKLKSYLKTSGGKGYHFYVPLLSTTWNKTEKISENIANILVTKHLDKYTVNLQIKSVKEKFLLIITEIKKVLLAYVLIL